MLDWGRAREERIVPVAVKRISAEVDDGEFVVRHLSPGGVAIDIQFTFDLEPRCGRGGPDQVDHHFMTDQFWVMAENSRCSILFHLLVPGGK